MPSSTPFVAPASNKPHETPVSASTFGPTFSKEDKPAKTAVDDMPSMPESDTIDLTLESLEADLRKALRENMEAVKKTAKDVKAKTNFDIIANFGSAASEVVLFRTSVTKEMPYTSKAGKSGTQRVNLFG